MDIQEAAKSGDRRKTLEAIRDHLAAELMDVRASVAIAPIAKQLADIVREIESLPGARKDSKSDDLAERRKTRRAAARKPTAASK